MKFTLSGRAFILPVLAGLILLFQNWIPAARIVCLLLNIIALVVIAVDYFVLPGPDAFTVERFLPEQFFLLVEAEVKIRIVYDISVPVRLQLVDHPPPSFQFQRDTIISNLGRGYGEAVCSYSVIPGMRGEMLFDNPGIRISTFAGFLYRQFTISLKQGGHIFPTLPTEREGLQSHFYVSQVESRIMRTYGPGREFAQMREYRRGDDIRTIHWKRSARCNKLIVREFEPEKGQNVFFMIDGGRLMMAETGGRSKVDWAIGSCISLAREALSKHDAVGALCFSNTIESYILPSNKKPQMTALVKTIYRFQPSFIEPDYAQVFQWVQTTVKQRCIIILFTDFIDRFLSSEMSTYIKLLKRKHRIICCSMGHNDMVEIGFRETGSLAEACFAAVVREGRDSRRGVLAELQRAGVDIIDVVPQKLCGALLMRYARARWGI